VKLENIGFYTLTDERAKITSLQSDMWRCELILTHKCNFKCPYCRGLRKDCIGEIPLKKAKRIIDYWAQDNLHNIRFSGGEPTLYPHLTRIVRYAKKQGIKRIAISTNGSANLDYYYKLIDCGVNDISISLDSCCSAIGKKMLGGIDGMWEKVVDNIKWLSQLTYVTVGMVFTLDNIGQTAKNIEFAHNLGVADIRIISSAQYNKAITELDKFNGDILNSHPILKYRIFNYKKGRNIRGISSTDNRHCPLVLDDSAVAGRWHFPCIIYMREHGKPIGQINKNMRKERYEWFLNHDTYEDPICRNNCLDVCIDYNNKYMEFHSIHGIGIPELSPECFTWSRWRRGSIADFIPAARYDILITPEVKKEFRKYAIGWCGSDKLFCRPKEKEIALMIFKNGEHSWFHLRQNEFMEIFNKNMNHEKP